ncbi:hypothetical protein, partial [Nocardia puris]|uniref:hypothetical protein n=1 Tax=Nocardia puris TaxID=208602 RepID=UPI001E38803E
RAPTVLVAEHLLDLLAGQPVPRLGVVPALPADLVAGNCAATTLRAQGVLAAVSNELLVTPAASSD